MSLLAVVIGNSHTTLGLLVDREVTAHWRVATDERRTADEWAVLVRALLEQESRSIAALSGVAVCSTVPSVLHEWRALLSDQFSALDSVIVEPGVRTGIPVLMDNPREVGSDRIVNALAAAAEFEGASIVVDFSMATTFDVVNPSGQYVGGAIAPGMELSLDALGSRGAQLRKVEIARPRNAIARNTIEALQSGMVFGVAAQVDGMVARMIAELGIRADEVSVIATGHLAPLVVNECSCFTAHEPWLTLRGLARVFERNCTPS